MPSRFRDERGSAAAEFAVALPAVALVLALCLAGLALTGQQVRLQDAAALAARALGRGDSPYLVVQRLAPGARLTATVEGDLVCVTLAAAAESTVAGALGLTVQATGCALGAGG